MPKRRHNESKEEKWERKRKKYEQKLNEEMKKKSKRIIYSSDEYEQNEDHLEPEFFDNQECSEVGTVPVPANEPTTENILPDPTFLPDVEPEVAAVVTDIDPDIDTDMLKALGELETDDTEWGADVQIDIAKRVQSIISCGLKKETKDELGKKYLFPKNIPLLKPPVLNPEISTMLNESSRNRDKRLSSKQEQHGRALAALTKAMSLLLKMNPEIPEVLRILNDTLKIMTDSHYMETDTRKSLILGLIDKSLVDSFKDRKRDEFLFGDKLGDLVKSSRGIKKTGQLIQASSHLNWKSPSVRPRSALAQKNQQSSRAGGYHTQYANRRRVMQPPAPPPLRRQPAATAPPPPRRQPPTYGAPYPARRPLPPPPPPRGT